jgi:hypothetical protein
MAANSLLTQQLGSAAATAAAGNGSSSAADSGGVSVGGRVYSKYRVAYKGAAPTQPVAGAAANGVSNGSNGSAAAGSSTTTSSSRQVDGPQPASVSAPGASRGLPAIAATAVQRSMPPAGSSSSSANGKARTQQQQPGAGGVEGDAEVREELSLLAALAAEMQKRNRL